MSFSLIAQFLNAKLTTIEPFIYDKPFHALFILMASVAVIFWVFYKLIGNDAAAPSTNFKDYKVKNARLD